MLKDSAELDKVKRKILADPARYIFPKVGESKNTNDKKPDADTEIDEDLIYMTLYKPSRPISQAGCTSNTDWSPAPVRHCLNRPSSDQRKTNSNANFASRQDLVQAHLDNSVLLRMISDLRDKGKNNALCILVTCAMQLGCNIPDWCRQELPLVGLPPEGKARFAKALREYRNGIPHPFNSKSLDVTVDTGNPFYQESEIFRMELEDVPAGEEITQDNTTIESIYGDSNQPVDVCGNCGAEKCDDGSKLKRCVGCKER
jgi:hypothetical protein